MPDFEEEMRFEEYLQAPFAKPAARRAYLIERGLENRIDLTMPFIERGVLEAVDEFLRPPQDGPAPVQRELSLAPAADAAPSLPFWVQ